MLNSQGCVVVVVVVYPLFLPLQKVANFPNGLLNDFRLPRRPLMVDGARSAAELRRSHCCDGDAQTSSVALILRVASATQLVLLRRS